MLLTAGKKKKGEKSGGEKKIWNKMGVVEGGWNSIGGLLPSDTSSNALGLNDLGFVVGESASKGFVFDISTSAIFNINSFTQLGFNTDTILRLTDINNTNQFVGVALVNGVEHGITGQ